MISLKRKADWCALKRRVLPALLCAALAGSSWIPLGGTAVYGAEQESGGLADLGQSFSEQGPAAAEADGTEAIPGEVSLFRSADGSDLRTYASAEADWYLGITKLEHKGVLNTTKYSTDYNGNVVKTEYENKAPEGTEYVIVNLALSKTVSGGDSFAADELTLTVSGTEYKRVLNDSFLTNHNYASFPNTGVLAGSKNGDVIFEVSTAHLNALNNWKQSLQAGTVTLKAGAVSGVAVEVDDDQLTPVPLGGYKVDEQFQIEQELLATYQTKTYGIAAPFFVRDPYGTAPLTGIAMFKTSREVDAVRVTVKGKTAASDISYEVPSKGTEHEIPVIGFYPNYQNTFVLEALSGVSVVDTGTISSSETNTSGVSGYDVFSSVNRNEQYPLEPGLTLLISNSRTVIDGNGDVRWFQKPAMEGCWGANQITERGTFYFPDIADGTRSKPSVIYEMNWSGKILGQYLYINDSDVPDAHHDLAETPDGQHFIYEVNNNNGKMAFIEVDKRTGAIVKRVNASDIITKTKTLEVRGQWGTDDWAHMNTIDSVGDGTYIISYRNQHLAIRYNWNTEEIVWAFSPAFDFHEENTPKLKGKMVELQNIGGKDQNNQPIEWFYSQHDTTLLPDQDGNPNTDDLLIFDNGVDRSLTVSTSPKYSRIVQYRIDKTTMKATQIFAWGKEDTSFYGLMYGGAERMPQTGNYIGTSSSKKFVEVTKEGKVALSITNPNYMYRCYKLSYDDFVKGYIAMGTVKGKAFMRVGDETVFKKTELPQNLSDSLTAQITGIYNHDQQLLVKGTAYRGSAGASKKVYLIADDGKNQYAAPLINGTASAFDNTVKTALPISVTNLPAARYNIGILVDDGTKAYKKTPYYLEKTGSLEQVLTDDAGQKEIVEELIAKAKDTANSLSNPVVAVDPFGKSPYSALAAFHTPKACDVTVTVQGKPASGDRIQADVTYTVSGDTQNHVVPIVGLYGNYDNTVVLEAGGKKAVVRVKTGEVGGTYVREAEVDAAAAERSQAIQGLTFMTPAGAQTVPFAIDLNGEVRWAYLCPAAAPVETKPLKNGHFLVPSDRASVELFTTDAETVMEIDLTGRIYGEYFLDGMPHHEALERENGNLIFALSRRNSTSMEDYMVEVDRATGKTLRTWDFRKILGIPEYDPSYDPEKNGMDLSKDTADAPHRAQPNVVITRGNHAYSDWFHQNSLDYEEGDPNDPSDDAIYVTSRHQSALIKINADKAAGETPQRDSIEWIYSDPSWLPQSSLDLEALLLKPEGAEAKELMERLADTEAEVGNAEADPNLIPNSALGSDSGSNQGLDSGSTEEAQVSDIAPSSIEVKDQAAQTESQNEAAIRAAELKSQAGSAGQTAGLESQNEPADGSKNQPEALAEDGSDPDLTQSVPEQKTGESEQQSGEPESKAAEGDSAAAIPSGPSVVTAEELEAAAAVSAASTSSSDNYVYGPHAVELLENGDLILYDNNLYGGKTTKPPAISKDDPSTAIWEEQQNLYSRAIRLRVDEGAKTFRIIWEYGRELGAENYTPFIGDIDYLGGPGGEDDHYLVDFGGITKVNGKACDVMTAMTTAGGSISANVREVTGAGENKKVLWSARFQGAAGMVSSVYRAERVNLSQVPFSAADYEKYSQIENRGMYRNTPQAVIDSGVIDSAAIGIIPASWTMLRDEGNRLIGRFTLPHVMTDSAAEGEKVENIYVVLKLGEHERRVYKADFIAASPALGTPAFYGFEIMRDNKAAQIQLLAQRQDGIWILGETGEIASADMQYATGDLPVIDPAAPEISVATQAGGESGSIAQLVAAGGSGKASVLTVKKGSLEPGMKYVYSDAQSGAKELVYSPIHGGYVLIVPDKEITEAEAENGIAAVSGTVPDVRRGIVADNWSAVNNGLLRTALSPSDLFYLAARVADGTVPVRDPQRVLAMDMNGDMIVDLSDVAQFISEYLYQAQ